MTKKKHFPRKLITSWICFSDLFSTGLREMVMHRTKTGCLKVLHFFNIQLVNSEDMNAGIILFKIF